MQFCSAHRPPRAGIDPIERAEQALAVIALAIERPPVAETIVLLLDHERRGVASPSSAAPPARTTRSRSPSASPPRAPTPVAWRARPRHRPPRGCPLAGDGDRWLEMSDITSAVGVELVEWFVIGDDIHCPPRPPRRTAALAIRVTTGGPLAPVVGPARGGGPPPASASPVRALHLHRPGRDELGAVLLRDVVMITLEPAARQPGHSANAQSSSSDSSLTRWHHFRPPTTTWARRSGPSPPKGWHSPKPGRQATPPHIRLVPCRFVPIDGHEAVTAEVLSASAHDAADVGRDRALDG